MKKLLKAAFVLVAAVLSVSCHQASKAGIKKSADGAITLVMAEVCSIDSISGYMDIVFKHKVEELSNGMIKIDLRTDGIFGDEEAVLNLMQSRNTSIHLSRISTFSLTSHGSKKSILLTIPYTFRNREHFWKFASSELAQEFLNEPYDSDMGLKGLFFGEEGFRHFFSVYPLKDITSLKGQKIRVATDPIIKKFARSQKSEPVFVSSGEIFSSLKTGIIDTADQPLTNYVNNSFDNAAPNLILDGHTLGVTQVVITERVWDYLSSAQKEILVRAGKYASEFCQRISREKEEEALKELKLRGVKITEVTDFTPWKEACSDLIKEYSHNYPELYEKILNLAD